MKSLAIVIGLACLFTTKVTAFGDRGVAERLFYWYAYQADWEGNTVAPDCKSTINPTGRCTIEEFLCHIWKPSNQDKIRPVPPSTAEDVEFWGLSHTGEDEGTDEDEGEETDEDEGEETDEDEDEDEDDHFPSLKGLFLNIFNWRTDTPENSQAQHPGQKPPSGMPKTPTGSRSFTWFLDPSKVVTGASYGTVLMEVVPTLNALKNRIAKNPGSKHLKERQNIYDNALTSIRILYNLRRTRLDDFRARLLQPHLEEAFRRKLRRRNLSSVIVRAPFQNIEGLTYESADKSEGAIDFTATEEKIRKRLRISSSEARIGMDTALRAWRMAAVDNENHWRVLDNVHEAMVALGVTSAGEHRR